MKRNKSIIFVLLILLAIASTAMALDAIVKWREGQAADGTTRRIGFRYPMPVQEQSIEAVQATSTAEIGTTLAVKCPTLSTNTRHVYVGTINGALNFGDSTVPTGAAYPFSIASGSYKVFNVATSTPDFYFRGATASATVHFMEL